jgi:hypothetical protein
MEGSKSAWSDFKGPPGNGQPRPKRRKEPQNSSMLIVKAALRVSVQIVVQPGRVPDF